MTTPLDKHPQTWLDVAIAVLRGDYIRADNSTREAIAIGLRSTDHPTCREALKLIGGRNAR